MRDASIQAKGPASGLLIVDDETEPRQALAALLASAGFDVRQAADAQQAEEHLTAGDVAIVVVDSDMPDVNGFQLCRRIREVYGSQPYLILRTTKDQLFSRELDVDEGADDFLIEPLSNKEVLARVETGRKMKQLQEKLEETNKSLALLEVTDPLTGAFNKRRTDSEVKREMARARRYGHPVSVVMLDIDGLRFLNHRLGRDTGDRALAEIARILKLSPRAADTVGRYGGEEFAVLLPETSKHEAFEVAEKIRKIIEQTAVAAGDKAVHVTVSGGVATFQNDNFASAADLVAAANTALEKAKAGGRNRSEPVDKNET